jgi:hypothetical protein
MTTLKLATATADPCGMTNKGQATASTNNGNGKDEIRGSFDSPFTMKP